MAWPPADGTPYMPANGTEGEGFYENWCEDCSYDAGFRDDPEGRRGCSIFADSFLGVQPKEWVWLKGRGVCTKFTDGPIPEPRCPYTLEMF